MAQFSRLREGWQRLSREAFGHRFMMDRIVPGGVTVDPDAAALAAFGGLLVAGENKRLLWLSAVAAGGAVGKRLDFLMQELNREANTLGSKSVSKELSDTSLEFKLLIEQMREQIQNIE